MKLPAIQGLMECVLLIQFLSVTMLTMWTLCEKTGSPRTMFGEIPGIAGEHLEKEGSVQF